MEYQIKTLRQRNGFYITRPLKIMKTKTKQTIKDKLISLAEQKGFNWRLHPQFNKYDYYLWMCKLQKWLREKYNIHIILFINTLDCKYEIQVYNCNEEPYYLFGANGFKMYEQTLEKALQNTLTLLI